MLLGRIYAVDERQHALGVILKREDECAEALEEFFPALKLDVEAVRCERDTFGKLVEARALAALRPALACPPGWATIRTPGGCILAGVGNPAATRRTQALAEPADGGP